MSNITPLRALMHADKLQIKSLLQIMPHSLWTMHTAIWDGFVDFRSDGTYWTHWGLGRYTVDGMRISLQNDYDVFSHTWLVGDDGTYSGSRSDGLAETGRFLTIYAGPLRVA